MPHPAAWQGGKIPQPVGTGSKKTAPPQVLRQGGLILFSIAFYSPSRVVAKAK